MERILLLILGLFMGFGTWAQNAPFPQEKKKFLDYVESKIAIGSGEKSKLFREEFEPFWEKATPTQEKFVYELTEVMLDKKHQGYPHIFQALLATSYFQISGTPKPVFSSWSANIKTIIDQESRKKVEPFLEASYYLAKDGAIDEGQKGTWFLTGGTVSAEDQKGWGFRFKGSNLKGINGNDTLSISGAEGFYYPKEHKVFGVNGKVTWRRVGLNPAKNSASLLEFELKTGSGVLRADSVIFTSEFYGEPLAGEFLDKLVTDADPSNATYPRFKSFNKNLVLEEIVAGVNYKGAMSVEGAKLLAIGSVNSPAALEFMKDGEPYLEATGIRFSITPNLISGEKIAVVIRLKKDSIYHPSLTFQFDIDNNTINLLQVNQQASQAPYFNSFQMVDIYAEKVWMNHQGDSIYFGAVDGSSVPRVSFESGDFFSVRRFNSLQLGGQNSPLYLFADIADKVGWKFNAELVTRAMGGTKGEAIKVIYSLAQKGFIYLNENSMEIEVKQKLFDYITARGEKKDYDVIRFESKSTNPKIPNAVMALDSFSIAVSGLSNISLSDSQLVKIMPDGRKIELLGNRNFKFDGKVRAGLLDFYGSNFVFDYDLFEVEMELIDSCKMFVINKDPEKNGKSEYIKVKSQIENLSGELLIDDPGNKSGLWTKNFTEYPVFTSRRESFVYYDKIEKNPGVYPKEGFYFELLPFEIDSLDNFDPATLAMGGTLKSAGIFPDIKNELSIQDDFSLGFNHATPAEGLPMYGGMAKFKNDIHLWNDGLQGDGDLEYLTSVSNSKKFTFFPDSTTGKANFHNEGEGPADVAYADSKITDLKYFPQKNTMDLKNIVGHFAMYQGEAKHTGSLKLMPQGLTGTGKLAMYDGTLGSNAFDFNFDVGVADSAEFVLNNVANNEVAIRNDNVHAEMNFRTKTGSFKSNISDDSKIEFPSTQYIAYMDAYDWLVEDKKIEFKSSMSGAVSDSSSSKQSTFYSVHPAQDSLNFVVKTATYDIDNYDILGKGVKRINIADAYIKPAGGDVLVHVGANMETLEKAEIIADRVNEFHRIFDATVNVSGAAGFQASGMYNYMDENGVKSPIPFQNIRVEDGTTVADGTISETENFKLNAAFGYRGNVNMVAPLKGLRFKGATKLLLAEEIVSNAWLVFDGQVDPKNVSIPVAPGMKSDEGAELYVGMVVSRQDMVPYRTFVRTIDSPEDMVTIMPTGNLSYNKARNQYEVNPVVDTKVPGAEKYQDVLSYNLASGVVEQIGETFFGMEYGQMDVRGFGKIKFNPKDRKLSYKGSLKMDFFFPEEAQKFISGQIESYPFLQPFSLLNTDYAKAVGRWASPKAAEKISEDITEKGTMSKVPKELETSFTLAEIRLTWDEPNERFLSSGKLGMAHFKEEISSVYVNGIVAFSAFASGDEMYLFMEPDPMDWFFFKYKTGRMAVVGRKDEYNAIFSELKPKDLELKTKKNQTPFQVVVTTGSKKKQFLESLGTE